MTFRFDAKYGLLTYAQSGGLSPDHVVEHLGRLGAECIIGREAHADGGTHLHAFFMFERKFSSRNVRVFDVDGCHPNVVRGYGTPELGYDYATKDGDVVAGGLLREDCIAIGSVRGSKHKWHDVIMASTRDEFFELCAELEPRALCCSFNSLKAYADWRYRPSPDPYEHPVGLEFDPERTRDLSQWFSQNVGGGGNQGMLFDCVGPYTFSGIDCVWQERCLSHGEMSGHPSGSHDTEHLPRARCRLMLTVDRTKISKLDPLW